MSVRFKPLIALCGVFLVVGAVGLSAFVLVASRSGNPLAKAKTEQATKQYDKALIDYQRARQLDPKNPEIAELIAQMYVEWAVQVPARAEDLRVDRLGCAGLGPGPAVGRRPVRPGRRGPGRPAAEIGRCHAARRGPHQAGA